MRRSNIGCRKHEPLRIVPDRGQVAENFSHPSSKQAWDVLHDREPGSYRAKASGELRPEPALVGIAEPLPCVAGGLAWEAAAHEVGSFNLPPVDRGHVAEVRHAGEMFRHPTGRITRRILSLVRRRPLADLWIPFGIPHGAPAMPACREVEAADAGEEAPDLHRSKRSGAGSARPVRYIGLVA